MKYEFYVFVNEGKGSKFNLSLSESIKYYNSLKTDGYKAIGVTKGAESIDLVNNLGSHATDRLSKDYLSTSFKDDKVVTKNVISVLANELGLNIA